MALRMRLQTSVFGPFHDVDLSAVRAARFRLQTSYSHPARLSWVMHQPQQSQPLPLRTFVQFWDDGSTGPDGVPYSDGNPLFEGFITEITPGEDPNRVEYVAYDPTRKASDEFQVMSGPWLPGSPPGVPPSEGPGAYPRLVFNSRIDNDDDFAFARENDATLGDLIATLLLDAAPPLFWCNASPGDGASGGSGLPWVPSELVQLTFRPQEKIVFESETIRAAIERLLQWMPHYRMLWKPGTRQFRFWDLTTSPEVTLTLNHLADAGRVLSLQLTRSLEGRYTAVRIFGPQTLTPMTASVSAGTLLDISNGPPLETVGGVTTFGRNRWQITNVHLRRVARLLPADIFVQTDDLMLVRTRSPQLEAFWPQTSGGPAGWRAIRGWSLDAASGIVSFNGTNLYRFNRNAAPGQPRFENPTDVRFVYATPTSPLQVRVPETGFSGTAFTEANLQSELQIHDEMLAVDYEHGQPVTTQTRVQQFTILADYIHRMRRDLIHAGGLVIDGLDFRFAELNRRVNLAAVDENGSPRTTGWERMSAFVTDVEYDFDEQLTTLQFSSDQLELIGMDPDRVKQWLRIRALQRRVRTWSSVSTSIRGSRMGDPLHGFSITNSIWETTIQAGQLVDYIDPETGLPG
jgi:hypothetical protein